MKIFENKRLFKKLIIVLLVVMIFNFCMPRTVRADDEIGGKLLNPIMSFIVSLGDGTMTFLQRAILDTDDSLIQVNSASGWWAKIIVLFTAVAAISLIVASAVLGAGAAGIATVEGIATIIKGTASAALIAGFTTVTFPVTTAVLEGMLPDSFQLPLFYVTPQEIFSNKLPLLDVDFFNPMEDQVKEKIIQDEIQDERILSFTFAGIDFSVDTTGAYVDTRILKDDDGRIIVSDSPPNKYPNATRLESDEIAKEINKEILNKYGDGKVAVYGYDNNLNPTELKGEERNVAYGTMDNYSMVSVQVKIDGKIYEVERDATTLASAVHFYVHVGEDKKELYLLEDNGLSNRLSDDAKSEYIVVKSDRNEKKEEVVIKSTASELKEVVATWYVNLRNIALVALLSVLVYIGIRILISSTSQDKAKYKQMLVDWIVAICLLFVMQYIMSFSNMIVKKIIEIVDTTQVSADKEKKMIEPEVFKITDKKKVSKAYETIVGKEGAANFYYQYFTDEKGNQAGSESTVLLWPAENFMQQARLKLQLLDDNEDTYVAIGWKLIYIVLVIYTVIFLWTYVKRVVYMAFLTIIAPLVALTYPIDKINDGKAQAFNMWFKEYIFNLLLQPMHLILYTILVGSAMQFASKNVVYVIVALGFMVPAEKLLRSFFGFEKAKTPGLLAGPAGAAIAMAGINKLLGKKSGSKTISSTSESGKDNDKFDDKSNLRFKNFDKTNAMLMGNGTDDSNAMLNGKGTKDSGGILNGNGNGNGIDGPNAMINGNRIKNPDLVADVDGNKKLKDRFAQSKTGRRLKAITKAGRYYGHKKLEKTGRKIQNSHPLRTGLKLYGGLAGLTAGAILGGVSGDPTKSVQYSMTGAMGMYNATDRILPDFSNDEDLNTAIEMGKQDYLGDEIDDYNIKKYIKNFQNNYDNQIKLEQALGSKQAAKDFMENDAGDYIEKGVTDIDDMIAINKLKKNGTVSTKDMGIATFKYAKRVGSKPKDMKKQDRDEWHNTFVNELKNNSYVKYSNLNVDDEVDKIMNRINSFYDAKN